MSFKLGELRKLIKEAFDTAYRLLGVSPGASSDEIRAAYKRKALELHPDRSKDPNATQVMAKVNRAFQLLSDPNKRSDYDRHGDHTLGDKTQPGSGAGNADDFWSDFARRARAAKEQSDARARAAQAEKQRQQQRPSPRQPPPPQSKNFWCNVCNREHFEKPQRHQFVYKDVTSRKFWWYERHGFSTVIVGWGRLGTAGMTKTHTFPSGTKANRFVETKVTEKLRKGYERASVAQPSAGQQSKAAPPPPPAAAAPQPKQRKEPTGRAPSNKTQYKIYGRKGRHSVHTRYGGKVYGPSGQSRFRPGASANVAMGSDGRLTVSDNSGPAQFWDASNESPIKRLVVEAVWDYIATL